MAVAATNLATTGNNADATSYATASITPTGNVLVLAWVYSIASAAPNTPTATGNGLTWVQVGSVLDSDSLRRLTLFRAMGAAPSTGAVTFDFAGQTQTGCVWSVAEFSGVNTGGTNGSAAIVQSDTEASVGSVSSLTSTLAAFASASNATAGGFGYPLNSGNGTTGSGFTEIGERFQATPNQAIYSEFRADNDTTVDMNIGASSVPIVGISVEIAAAVVTYSLAEVLQDNFNDNALDSTKWTTYGTTTYAKETNKQLRIYTTTVNGYGGIISVNNYDLTSSYMHVELVSASSLNITTLEVYFKYSSGTNALFFNISGYDDTIAAFKTIAGVNTSLANVPYDAVAHRFLQIREEGGTTYFETSADGINWDVFHSLANPYTLTSGQIELGTGTYGNETTGAVAIWDNLNVSPASNLNATYTYKISDVNDNYLGILDDVTSLFKLTQEINKTFSALQVDVALDVDVADQPIEALLDENGNTLLDENGNTLYEEQRPEVIGPNNPNALINCNNKIRVYEYTTEDPDGHIVFDGYIESYEAEFGTDASVSFIAVSNGVDLVDHLVSGGRILDQSQATGASTYVLDSSKAANAAGQSIDPGVGIDNLLSVVLKLEAVTGNNPTVYVDFFYTKSGIFNMSTFLGLGTPDFTASKVITSVSAAEYEFTANVDLSDSLNYYVIGVRSSDSSGVRLYYAASNAYAAGTGILSGIATSDLYFKTYSGSAATDSPFSSEDPADIVTDILDTYVSEGGAVTYDGGSIDASGVIASYTFKVNTVLEGLQKCLELAPSDFYYYVNPATQVLYFKQTATEARHTFIKGRHFNSLKIGSTVEDVRNVVYFSGGDTGSGDNLYSVYTNQDSVNTQGRQRIERKSDNRVTVQATADLIADNFLDEHAEAVYSSPIAIDATTYDLNTINPGDTIALQGFGTFIDSLILQVAALTRFPDSIDITLGILLDRQSDALRKALSDLDKLQTVDNPSSPS